MGFLRESVAIECAIFDAIENMVCLAFGLETNQMSTRPVAKYIEERTFQNLPEFRQHQTGYSSIPSLRLKDCHRNQNKNFRGWWLRLF